MGILWGMLKKTWKGDSITLDTLVVNIIHLQYDLT